MPFYLKNTDQINDVADDENGREYTFQKMILNVPFITYKIPLFLYMNPLSCIKYLNFYM